MTSLEAMLMVVGFFILITLVIIGAGVLIAWLSNKSYEKEFSKAFERTIYIAQLYGVDNDNRKKSPEETPTKAK